MSSEMMSLSMTICNHSNSFEAVVKIEGTQQEKWTNIRKDQNCLTLSKCCVKRKERWSLNMQQHI